MSAAQRRRTFWVFRPHQFLPLAALLSLSTVQAAETAAIPLKKVVMFNSGVGYFERRAEIEGDVQVDLKFNVDDINDLLQSMVLQDLGGGSITTVTYSSKEPITRTLGTFAIDLTDDPTLGALLRQVRGEQVQIDSGSAMKGLIVGVELRPERVGDDKIFETEHLNLLTDDGLASVPLAGVRRIKLLNEKLDAELREALAVLALGHAADKKTVTLNFSGAKRRAVRVGYIQESPIWKTSYRLVLDADDAPLLQGWALAENTTEEDWKDIRLTLVSGRPISFVMDLYQSLFVARPVVAPELFDSIGPQTYEQDLADKEQRFRRQAGRNRGEPQVGIGGMPGRMGGLGGVAFGGAGFGGAGGVAGGDSPAEEPDAALNPAAGVQTSAAASDVGELFHYEITQPVNLPRQKSAMLPIVNQPVKAEKVSIYNPRVHAKHPLNGLQLVNATSLHLMQGPIAVFDGGAYAGNAQLLDLPPGGRRLLSYAIDLETEVAVTSENRPQHLTGIKIVGGVTHVSSTAERSHVYVVKNSGDRAKRLLIEYPIAAGWTLVEPEEPAEKTRDQYRFALDVKPGEPARLEIRERKPATQQLAVDDLSNDAVALYIQSEAIADEIKSALAEVQRRKGELVQLEKRHEELKKQLADITKDQTRIRDNMAKIDRNADLYDRYLKKLNQQEDEVESLQEEAAKTLTQMTTQRQALGKYIAGLKL